MASIILEKTGERIPVDESFFDLSKHEQQRQVDEFLSNREIEKKREYTQQQKELIEDISPFYLYSPLYIHFLVLVFFCILIIKKKIRSGWARIATFLSIIWTLLCVPLFLNYTPSSLSGHSYLHTLNLIKGNIGAAALYCLVPIILLFGIFWFIKWIREGFKADENQLN